MNGYNNKKKKKKKKTKQTFLNLYIYNIMNNNKMKIFKSIIDQQVKKNDDKEKIANQQQNRK
jgi:hypothetical protein